MDLGGQGNGPHTHVLEATVEGLKLCLGELGPSQQLLQPLGLVPDCRELHISIAAVFQERPPGKISLRNSLFTPKPTPTPLKLLPSASADPRSPLGPWKTVGVGC